ncbi:MAG: hypothetical protein IJX47_05645, partial [Clostridia bacterium]|nr:hypothetical protein [Clostridia bacterium]
GYGGKCSHCIRRGAHRAPVRTICAEMLSVHLVRSVGSFRLVAAESCYSPPPAVSEASVSEGGLVCLHHPTRRTATTNP